MTITYLFLILFSYFGSFLTYEVLDDEQYKIVWGSTAFDLTEPSQSIALRSSRGESYECTVPFVSRTKSEAALNYSIDTNDFLEQLIKLQPCATRIEYYWTYELCHNKHIRQYHEHPSQDKSTTTQEYYLGYFQQGKLPIIPSDYNIVEATDQSKPVADTKPPTITLGEKSFPYFKTQYANGTHCDLTDVGRSASVLYICHEEVIGGIIQVSEVETCKYEVIFATQLLCGNPAYMVSKPVTPVSCVAQAGSAPKPAALVELENERKDRSRSGLSSLAGLLGDAFKHVQIEMERRDDFSVVYRIRAVGENKEKDGAIDSTKNNQNSVTSMADSGGSQSLTGKPEPQPYSRSATYSQLLSFLRGEFCLVGHTAGWWRHELCFRSNVTQFHVNDRGKRVQNVLLGEWNRELHDQWRSEQPIVKEEISKRHADLFYGHGDFCFEIGDSRQSLIKIRCEPTIRGIYLSFAEQSPCKYSVLVESASFCDMSDEEWKALVL